MHIKMLTIMARPTGGFVYPGMVLDLPEKEAHELIKVNAAVSCKIAPLASNKQALAPAPEKSEEEKEAEKQAAAKAKRDADIAELSVQIPGLEKALEEAEDALKVITDKSARKEAAKMVKEGRKKLDEVNDRLMKLQKGM